MDAGNFLQQASTDGVNFLSSSFNQAVSSFLIQAVTAGTTFANSVFAQMAGSFLQQAATAGVSFANLVFAQDAASFLNQAFAGSLSGSALVQDWLSYVNQTIYSGAVGSTFAQYALPFLDQVVEIGFAGTTFAQDVGSLVPDGLGRVDRSAGSITRSQRHQRRLSHRTGRCMHFPGLRLRRESALQLSADLYDSPGPVSLAQSFVTVSAASIPYGGTATVTLIARDAAGNLETSGGLAVLFVLGSGGSVARSARSERCRQRYYTATFSGANVGPAETITASISGAPLSSSAPTVTVHKPAATLTITASGQSKTYGQTMSFGSGSTQFTSSGLQNGETIGSVALAVSGSGGSAKRAGWHLHHYGQRRTGATSRLATTTSATSPAS